MVVTACPNRETLLQYSLGFLLDEQQETLDRHLHECPECQATILTLDDAGDEVIGLLRMPIANESTLTEPQLQDALTAAMAIPARTPIGEEDSSAARRLAPGMPEALGEYRLLEELGRGGMSRVYKAVHTKLNRLVVLKVLPRTWASDQKAIGRFEREMKAIGELAHPNIVEARDAREIDGAPVLVMELVDGLDLARIVRRIGPVPITEACELIRQTALALQCAHDHKLVHRDVKPSNIMLARSGEVKLLDLGLARSYSKDRIDDSQITVVEELTGTGQAVGTADYMAPEQASEGGTIDIRADLYSLGCTFYKLLSGRAPFSGPRYRTTLDKLNAHVHQPVPFIRRLVPEVPEKLAAILDRLLAKDPVDRFSTPAELAEALAPWCVGANLPALLERAMEADRGPELDENPSQPSRTTETVARPGLQASWNWKRFAGQLVLLMLVSGLGIALGITVRIQKDGKETAVDVPDGGTARIRTDGQVEVVLPSQTKKPQSKGQTPPSSSTANPWALLGPWRVGSVQKGKRADEVWPTLLHKDPQEGNSSTFDRLTFDETGGVTFFNLKTGWKTRLTTTIDPNAVPTVVDLVSETQAGNPPTNPVTRGIYELQGDRLKIRWRPFLSWMNTTLRPADFTVDANSADLVLVLWRPRHEQAVLGGWSAILQIEDGKEIPQPNQALFLFDADVGHSVVLTLTPDEKEKTREIKRGRCLLDVTKEPKWLTIPSYRLAGETGGQQDLLGVYKLDDGRLEIAYRIGGVRPEQLESKPGSGVTRLVLERPKLKAPSSSPQQAGTDEHTRALAELEKLGAKLTVDETRPGKPVKSVVWTEWYVTDAELAHLERLSQLQSLDLSFTRLIGAGLKSLRGLTQLESLSLRNTAANDGSLAHLQRLAQLQSLDLSSTRVSDTGLVHLQGLNQLQSLNLSKTRVIGKGLVHLRGLAGLQSLDFTDTKLTDEGLESLQSLAGLRIVCIGGTAVTDAGLKHVQRLTNLHTLTLYRTKVTDAGLKHLAGLTKLETLYVGGPTVTDAGLEHLKALTNLKVLNLVNLKVTDAGLAQLKNLTNLVALNLVGTGITDAGLAHLQGLARLERVNLTDTKVTEEGRKKLQEALPNCRILP